jgi:uncharacterized protein
MTIVPYPDTELDDPLRTVLWERIDVPGTEWCALGATPDGWRLAGKVMPADAGAPAVVRYEIALADDWSTHDVRILRLTGDSQVERLRLSADGLGHWRVDRDPGRGGAADRGETLPAGMIDVDLGCSPATNTLPIRRLAPGIGEAIEVTALWVRFPQLTVEPLPQRYVRLTERRYRYESGEGAFVTELEVDDLGLVTTYEGGWRRTAAVDAIAA